MGLVSEIASFAYRMTIDGAEAVEGKFGSVGKKGADALKNVNKAAHDSNTTLDAMVEHLEGVSSTIEGVEKLKSQLMVIAELGGMTWLVESSLKAASSVQKMADDTGLSTTAVQELTYALRLHHVETETATKAMTAFSDATTEFVTHNSGPAKQAYETLFGANAQQIAAQGMKNVDQFFMQVLDRIGKLKNESEKIQLTRDFFSKDGQQLIGAANAGIEKLREEREEAERLGIVFGEDVIQKASDAEDKISILASVLKTKLAIAIDENADKIAHFADIALEDLPAVITLIDKMADVADGVVKSMSMMTVMTHDVGVMAETKLQSIGQLLDLLQGKMPRSIQTDDLLYDKAMYGDDGMFAQGLPHSSDIYGSLTGVDPEIAAMGKKKDEPKKESAGGGLKIGNDDDINKAKQQQEAYDRLTYSLQQQITAMGTSDREMAVNTEVRKLGAKATDEQKEKVAELAGQLYDEREKWGELKSASQEVGQDLGNFFEDAIENAKDFNDVLGDLLKSLAKIAYQYFVGNTISKGFSTFMETGSFTSSSTASAASYGGHKAGGGPLEPNKWYIAGEHGKEPIWGGGAGAYAAGYSPQKGGAGGDTFIDMRGASVEAVAKLENMMKQMNATFDSRAISAVGNAKMRSLDWAGG